MLHVVKTGQTFGFGAHLILQGFPYLYQMILKMRQYVDEVQCTTGIVLLSTSLFRFMAEVNN